MSGGFGIVLYGGFDRNTQLLPVWQMMTLLPMTLRILLLH
jgi:hypothetical protein